MRHDAQLRWDEKPKGPDVATGALRFREVRSAAIAHKAQQHQEQIDEVEVKLQGAEDRFPAGDGSVVATAHDNVIHVWNPLTNKLLQVFPDVGRAHVATLHPAHDHESNASR